MALKIDRVQLQFEIKPDYDQQQLLALKEDLKKANRELSQTEREIEKLKKAKPFSPSEQAQWRSQLDQLSKKYQEQVVAVQNAQRAVDKHIGKMGLENLSMAELTNRARTLNTILRNLNPNSPSYTEYKNKLEQINTRLKELRGTAASTRLSLAKLADGFNRYAALTASAVASLTGLALTVRKCVDDYAKMEDVMAGVRKYTGQTDEQVREMNEDFKQMDTRTPREKLNDLAGAAGRLGITNKAMIKEFVDGADKIGVALGDDLGEGAVDTIGKLAIAFGEDKTKGLRGAMLATGSALNEIVQNSPAQAQPVIEFTEMLSGVGQQAHLTQAQIMGYAAALDQNNQEMATASTVMSQLITKMYQDPARFAQMAGMEVAKFKELIHTDMNQAIVEWLQHVNKLGDMSVLAGKFDQLKMDGTRAVGVLSTLAGHIDQVTEAQRIATEAYAEGTSVIEEFNIQNNTVQAEIDKARKRFADLSIELGQKLMPLARYAITSGSAAVKMLSRIIDFTSNYRTTLLLTATALAGFIVYEKADVIQKQLMVLWNEKVVATSKRLWAVLIAHPWAVLAAGVAVVVGLMADYIRRANQATLAQKAMAKVENEATVEAEKERFKLEQLRKVVHDNTISLDERRKAIATIQEIVPGYVAEISKEGKVYNENTAALDEYIKKLKERALVEGARKEIEEMGDQMAKLESQRLKLEKDEKNRRDRNARNQQAAIPGAVGVWSNQAQTAVAEGAGQQMINAIEKKQKELQDAVDRMGEVMKNAAKIGDDSSGKSGNTDNTDNTDNSDDSNKTGSHTTSAGENRQRNEERKRMKQEEDLAKAERQKADLEAKQEYQQRLITEEEYHDRRYQNEQAFIARLQQIRESGYATEAERQEVQNMSLDALINEANYQQEQKRKQMNDTLQLMERSYQADQIALEQMRYSGEIATEEEYNNRKIEAEIDYQRERLRIIREAGGDTMEADNALQRALLEQTKEGQAQRLKELNKEMDDAALRGDYDRQLSIQQQMLDERLITQEQYERNITDLTRQAEQDRQAIRESYAQAAGQLLSSTSSLFSAMQNREEARVDKKYKTLIDRAKKNGKDTSKLEEQQEQEKLEIKKKYADKQFALTVLEIIAQGALGIQKIWAEWGWNPPVAVGLTATESAVAAIQLATAKAQRDQAAGLYTGGYSDEVEGYTGDGDPRDMAGVIPVHKREFVINHEALKIPVVRRVADVIDNMQKRKVYHIQDTTRVLQNTIIRQTGMAQGGYSGDNGRVTAAIPTAPMMDDQGIINSIERNTRMLQQLLEEGITVLQLRKRIRHEEQLERNASRS